MECYRLIFCIKYLLFAVLSCGFTLLGQTAPADPGWPRYYTNGTSELVVYQPQVDAWTGFKTLSGRCAFALHPVRGSEAVYGTFRFTAESLVDTPQKLVLLRNISVTGMRFPSAPGGQSAAWSELTGRLMPADAMVVSLGRLLAFVHAGEVPHKEARVLTDPPPIFVSTQPAVLVIVDGDPFKVEVENSPLKRVVNTNWDLYQDRRTSVYYLRLEKTWLKSADLAGAFASTAEIPPELLALTGVASEPGPAPRVIVVHKPGELIVIKGSPDLAPVTGTELSSVTNTESDLFFYTKTRSYYFLTSGRWFRAASLQGGWQYASASLPDDFRRIPPEHPRAHLLASVPGTREAEDAVLLAAIPRTAEVNRATVKAEAQYVGTPQFVPIPGTSIQYGKNTPNDVLRIGDLYYLCLQAVWFVSTTPNGPWEVAGKVPPQIYSIPESSPKYHVTYVQIYESTPDTIVVGYTPGYYGAYVSGGTVVWGTGYYYPPYVAMPPQVLVCARRAPPFLACCAPLVTEESPGLSRIGSAFPLSCHSQA